MALFSSSPSSSLKFTAIGHDPFKANGECGPSRVCTGGCLSWCTRCHTWWQQAGSCISCPALEPVLKPGCEVALIPIHCMVSSHPSCRPLLLCLHRGDLEVIYPELGDVGCLYIPKCHQYRERISREWGSPRVRYPQADRVSPASLLGTAPSFAVLTQGVAGSQGTNPLGKCCLRMCVLGL